MLSMNEVRQDFERSTNKSMSMPIAGCITWIIISVLGFILPFKESIYAMLFGTGIIFPIALLVGRIRKESIVDNENPFARLMGACVVMVNLLWAVHIPLVIYAPEFVPLTLGIGLGMHWIVYSWIIQHNVGIIHSITRSVLVLAMWVIFPEYRVTAVGLAISFVYIISLFQMSRRQISFS